MGFSAVRNYLKKRPFGGHDLASAVGAALYEFDPPSVLATIIGQANLAERAVRPASGAREVSGLRPVEVLSGTGVNQVRKHAQRILIGKGHLVGDRLLNDAADCSGKDGYTRREMTVRVVAEPCGEVDSSV